MDRETKEKIEMINLGKAPAEYKKYKFAILPKNWCVYKFEEMFIFSGGMSLSRGDLGDKGLCYLHYGDIHKMENNFIDVQEMKDILPKADLNKNDIKEGSILRDGDIAFVDASEDYKGIGKNVVIVNKDNIPFISGLHTIIAKDKTNLINDEFKRFLFSSYYIKKQIMYYTTGVSVLGITQSNIKKIKMVLPNIKEQKKIANIISTWDKAIKLKEKIIIQKKEKYYGLIQKLLTGKVRLNGFNQDWKTVKLGDVLKERTERGYDSLELLSITSSEGVIKRSELDRKNTSSSDKSKYKRIRPLDIGYNTMRMWQGVCGVSENEGIVSPAYTILKPTDKIDPYFMGYLFKLPEVINLFHRYSQGIVNDTLNLKYKHFKLIKVKIPIDIIEQKEIAKILKTQDKEIELLKKEVEALKKQKKGLMQLLLTGKVRVYSESNY